MTDLIIAEVAKLREEIAALEHDLASYMEAANDYMRGEEAAQAEVARLLEALIWCSGSQDFQDGGVARKGWLKLCAPLVESAALSAAQPVTSDVKDTP